MIKPLFLVAFATALAITVPARATVLSSGLSSRDATDTEQLAPRPLREVQTSSSVRTEGLHPAFNDLTTASLEAYDNLDPQHLVPTTALENAVRFFAANKSRIQNQTFMTIVDMTQNSSKKRMFVVNMTTGAVQTYLVAHGSGSDTNDDGYAERFSDTEGSLMTSLGFYTTGSTYQGKNGLSLYLNGLESTNAHALERGIVMHGADYVNPSHTGRSWGCLAIEKKYVATLIPALKNSSLLYIWKQ
jgi:hypothetical protein